ncbi:hypothetical protein [Collinsella tanakaei]|uniref:hypothetical protein n=1 Tax=Collinsella tanakaei TaxID=626935 RepID=UPI0022E3DF86|nr:hypothetical protein [Collinsella tanakaei]
MSFLTDEQAVYLAQLYTGTEVPELHHVSAAHVRRLEREYADRGMTIQQLCRTIHYRNKRIAELEKQKDYLLHRLDNRIGELAKALMLARRRGETIHKLERRLHKANRKHAALHRAMHEDTKKISGALCKSFDRFFALLARDSAPVEWPCFDDREPVLIGNWIAAEMGPFKVGSILFCDGHVLIYDEQHFHYVKLRDGEFAEHDPYGRR